MWGSKCEFRVNLDVQVEGCAGLSCQNVLWDSGLDGLAGFGSQKLLLEPQFSKILKDKLQAQPFFLLKFTLKCLYS